MPMWCFSAVTSKDIVGISTRKEPKAFAAHVPAGFQTTIQLQFSAELKLNVNNPTVETIRKDIERFGFTLNFEAEPANGPRVTHLGHLNKWRNAVAHQKTSAPAGIPPLTLTGVQSWLSSCDELATWLDDFMYNQNAKASRRRPVVTAAQRDQAMTTNNIPERLKVGDRVKILNSGLTNGGKIVESRGPLGPGGALIYRVLVRGKPNPAYGEFREDQLEIITRESNGSNGQRSKKGSKNA